MEINLFKAGVKVELQKCSCEDNYFLQEYFNINSNANLNKWKKIARNVEFEDSEKLIFDLLMSLKEDIVRIEEKISHKNSLLPLEQKNIIESLNFEYLNFLDAFLEKDKEYYVRFEINNQKMAIFVKACDEKMAKIIKIKPEDEMIYDAFVVEMQRNIIRNLKEK